MKKQTILKSFLLSILILSVHTQVHALSEITGTLSSSGATTQQNTAVPTSVATATLSNIVSPSSITGSVVSSATISSSGVANGNNQMNGSVTGGSSSGGGTSSSNAVSGASGTSSGSSGGGGTKQDALVLGVSTTSNTSKKPKATSFTSDGLAFVPESSRLAVTEEPSVEDTSVAQTDANINNENNGLMSGGGASALSEGSSIEERFGFESATWFWMIILGLVLLAVITYRYMRTAGDDINQIR